MPALDAFQLARRQLELDAQRMRAFPWLAGRKRKLMQASILGFFRGSARLFYEILQDNPNLAKGPGGRGWITGDLHLENFGAYRHDSPTDSNLQRVLFNLNDFDEAVVGPWRYDLLRFLTSFLLAAPAPPDARMVRSCEEIIESYIATAMRSASVPRPPEAVRKMIENVRNRTRKQLLDARTRIVRGKRRFIRGERFRSLGKELAAKARKAFSEYAKKLPERAAFPDAMEILDVAFRIAGTGSLGLLRVAVLVKGKGGPDGAWLFDMKEEERPPAPSLLVGTRTPPIEPAERVVRAFRACLEVPPQRIGTTRLDGRSMLVRRLAPQEDRVSIRGMGFDELSGLASFFAALTGAAHRRGSRGRPPTWSQTGREQLLGSALSLAGIHQATYAAFCRLPATGRARA
jgi:uncharacterized protein (DUF2252 family)